MRFLLSAMLLFVLVPMGCCLPTAAEQPNADGSRRAPLSYDSPNKWADPGIWADNGMFRVRADKNGIMWFDVFHPEDKKWYVNKNNLNLTAIVNGKLENTELAHVQPNVEVIKQTDTSLQLRYHYQFSNGAKVDIDMYMKEGEPELRYVAHTASGCAKLDAFMWHITFGQHEAVQTLAWQGKTVNAAKLKKPFPGGRVKAQHVEWFDNIKPLDFRFKGNETKEPDPNNPKWMSRVLGLEQHATWTKPLRDGDQFAFEARDQPWQKSWGMPEVTPWIEALWVVRKGEFLEGDELIYRVENLWTTGTETGDENKKKRSKGKSKHR